MASPFPFLSVAQQEFVLLQRLRQSLEAERTLCDLATRREKLKRKVILDHNKIFNSRRCQGEPEAGPTARQSRLRANQAQAQRDKETSQAANGESVNAAADKPSFKFRFNTPQEVRRWQSRTSRTKPRRKAQVARAWASKNCPTFEAMLERVPEDGTAPDRKGNLSLLLGVAFQGQFVQPVQQLGTVRTSARRLSETSPKPVVTKAPTQPQTPDKPPVLPLREQLSKHTLQVLDRLGAGLLDHNSDDAHESPEFEASNGRNGNVDSASAGLAPRNFGDWYNDTFSAGFGRLSESPSKLPPLVAVRPCACLSVGSCKWQTSNLCSFPGVTPQEHARRLHEGVTNIYCLEIVKRLAM